MKIFLGCFYVLFLFCASVRASDAWGGESLRGAKPFKIAVTMGACPAELSMKVVQDLNRDIEVKLRIARIPVDSKANLPMLDLDISCLRINVGTQQIGYAFYMQLSFDQYLLVDEAKQHYVAITWQATGGETCSTDSCPDDVRAKAKNMTDTFIIDFLKANEGK
jgi:hypothetical protein